MGNPEAARQIIGHTDDVMDDMNKVMTTFYADVVDEAGMATRKDIYFGFEGLMAKSIGQTSFQGLATELGLQIPDATEDIVYPDFKKGDATVGINQQKKKLSVKERKLQEKINLATMQDTLSKKELSITKTDTEKIQTTASLTPEQIEKAATNEQLHLNLQSNLKQQQRAVDEANKKAKAVDETKKAAAEMDEKFSNKWGPRTLKNVAIGTAGAVGLEALRQAPVVRGVFFWG